MAYGFNEDKSKFDLTAFQKKATRNVKTSKNGWFNLADLGLKPNTQVPICVIIGNKTMSATVYYMEVI